MFYFREEEKYYKMMEKEYEQEKEFREEFLLKHPFGCTKCFGLALITTSNYPHSPDDVDSCSNCVEEDICPWCGKKTIVLNEEIERFYCTNPFCHWNEEKGQKEINGE